MKKTFKSTLYIAIIVVMFSGNSFGKSKNKEEIQPAVQPTPTPTPSITTTPFIARTSANTRYANTPDLEQSSDSKGKKFESRSHRHHHHKYHRNTHYNYYNRRYHVYPYVYSSTVYDIPNDHVTVTLRTEKYAYHEGIFYKDLGSAPGYKPAAPPVGAVVPAIPDNAQKITIIGDIYFFYNGIYYRKVVQGFEVANDPT